jgi:glycosyltransferase involved in cell wall biosynthesis
MAAEPTLRIAVDGREIAGRPTGVGRYLAGVLQAWSAADFPHHLHLILHAPPPEWIAQLPLTMQVEVIPTAVAGTWWEQTALPAAARRAAADVLLAPAYTAPLRSPCPVVQIIHDVSFFAQPSGFRWREGLRRRLVTRASARRAAAVLTDSRFSADEIARHTGVARDRIVMAPQGAPDWSGGPPAAERAPLVLSVGTLFNRRHVPELLEAFAIVHRALPDARLVLVGGNQTHPTLDPIAIANRHGVSDAVTWTPWVDDTELTRLYQSARAFAFLSDYEGFGMTPMEAAAHGVPSVMLDTPVAREVYGADATLVPLEVTAVGAALLRLLTDADTHRRAVEIARARLPLFRWSDTGAIVRAALERCATRRTP